MFDIVIGNWNLFLVSTEKEFHASTIEVHGINALSYAHRRSVEAIKAAAGEGWKVVIVNAKMIKTKNKTGGYYDYFTSYDTTSSILQIFDEEGNDVTEAEEWLKEVVDFDSALDGDSDTGMVLDTEYCEDNWWGECTSSEKKSRTITEHYRATFLLVSTSWTIFTSLSLYCLLTHNFHRHMTQLYLSLNSNASVV